MLAYVKKSMLSTGISGQISKDEHFLSAKQVLPWPI